MNTRFLQIYMQTKSLASDARVSPGTQYTYVRKHEWHAGNKSTRR